MMIILKLFLLITVLHVSYELNNGLGRTPQMGKKIQLLFVKLHESIYFRLE